MSAGRDADVAVVAGRHNDITDVDGVRAGHYRRIGRGWLTGTTVIVPPPGTVGSVDVRGGAPGSRETDLLDPRAAANAVDAICLTGGSAYGLAAADGVMGLLAERGRGFPVGPADTDVVPIVPAAVVFDLGRGGVFTNRPDASFGRRATAAALAARHNPAPIAQGVVGAGTGTRAGGLKGGLGSASALVTPPIGASTLPDDEEPFATVAALAVVNAAGSPVDLRTGALYGRSRLLDGELPWLRAPTRADAAAARATLDELAARRALAAADGGTRHSPRNTTLVVIATDAALTKAECHKLAGIGHDGLARAISPLHLSVDGDLCFALATGARPLPADAPRRFGDPSSRSGYLDRLITAAADAVTRAVVHAMVRASTFADMPAYLELYASAISRRVATRRVRATGSRTPRR